MQGVSGGQAEHKRDEAPGPLKRPRRSSDGREDGLISDSETSSTSTLSTSGDSDGHVDGGDGTEVGSRRKHSGKKSRRSSDGVGQKKHRKKKKKSKREEKQSRHHRRRDDGDGGGGGRGHGGGRRDGGGGGGGGGGHHGRSGGLSHSHLPSKQSGPQDHGPQGEGREEGEVSEDAGWQAHGDSRVESQLPSAVSDPAPDAAVGKGGEPSAGEARQRDLPATASRPVLEAPALRAPGLVEAVAHRPAQQVQEVQRMARAPREKNQWKPMPLEGGPSLSQQPSVMTGYGKKWVMTGLANTDLADGGLLGAGLAEKAAHENQESEVPQQNKVRAPILLTSKSQPLTHQRKQLLPDPGSRVSASDNMEPSQAVEEMGRSGSRVSSLTGWSGSGACLVMDRIGSGSSLVMDRIGSGSSLLSGRITIVSDSPPDNLGITGMRPVAGHGSAFDLAGETSHSNSLKR